MKKVFSIIDSKIFIIFIGVLFIGVLGTLIIPRVLGHRKRTKKVSEKVSEEVLGKGIYSRVEYKDGYTIIHWKDEKTCILAGMYSIKMERGNPYKLIKRGKWIIIEPLVDLYFDC